MLTTTLRTCTLGTALTTAMLTVAAPTTARASAPALVGPVMGPQVAPLELTPTDGYRRWSDERRKLRIQTGVSAGLAAAFLVAGVLALTVNTCQPPASPGVDDACGIPVGKILATGTFFSAAAVTTIPAIVFGVRLGKHNRQRPVAALQFAPGGLALRF